MEAFKMFFEWTGIHLVRKKEEYWVKMKCNKGKVVFKWLNKIQASDSAEGFIKLYRSESPSGSRSLGLESFA